MSYSADMLKFKKMVLSSQDFNSNEYGTTREYGQNPSLSSGDNSREIPKAFVEIKRTYT
ncbi:proline-rich receptor-like protein kinase perk5 [Phtheirospermum japonicum]|uniref:Proline-rich receptor-like protein kinase perk5 n=1 Tax=Phtheirospermum japonicum TaxID=374723 RepID=A0A830CS86_9LAMI|nr:proline-rich receptor-like protein kinase perk5 [Phtheirospermum japonicum]